MTPLKTPLSPYPTSGPKPRSRARSGCSLGSEKDPRGDVPTESSEEGLGDDMLLSLIRSSAKNGDVEDSFRG